MIVVNCRMHSELKNYLQLFSSSDCQKIGSQTWWLNRALLENNVRMLLDAICLAVCQLLHSPNISDVLNVVANIVGIFKCLAWIRLRQRFASTSAVRCATIETHIISVGRRMMRA